MLEEKNDIGLRLLPRYKDICLDNHKRRCLNVPILENYSLSTYLSFCEKKSLNTDTDTLKVSVCVYPLHRLIFPLHVQHLCLALEFRCCVVMGMVTIETAPMHYFTPAIILLRLYQVKTFCA